MSAPKFQPGEVTAFLLPEITLPSSVRYHDDLARVDRSITHLSEEDRWTAIFEGRPRTIDFGKVDLTHRPLFKRCVVDLLRRSRNVKTAWSYASALLGMAPEIRVQFVNGLIALHPQEFASLWHVVLLPKVKPATVTSMRALCRTVCRLGIGMWSDDLLAFVSALRGHVVDKHAIVKTFKCFLPASEQSKIVYYADDLVARLNSRLPVTTHELVSACVLILAFQHAMRPGQIARIEPEGVVFYDTGAVHIVIPYRKQRMRDVVRGSRRAVNRVWTPIFHELRNRLGSKQRQYFFDLTPDQVGRAIKAALGLCKTRDWDAMELRHSAAQRLADAGCSHEQIARFLTHKDTATALVYITTSPRAVERINEALGLSPLYTKISDIASGKTISRRNLGKLDPDNVVGGVANGVPLVGLGACTIKQSLCTKNPITSCYLCHQFIPLADPKIHEEVAAVLRQVVHEFMAVNPPGASSAPLLQLRPTLSAAQVLADQLAGVSGHE